MQFEYRNIYFNKIIVIESLGEGDRKTGTELHSDTISRMAWKDPKLKTEIIRVEDRDGFLSQLIKIDYEVRTLSLLPFIHFEMHGTKDGLALASGTEVPWTDIIPLISEINKSTQNNVFISVAACWGGNIQFQIDVEKPCPFRGFIGPMNELYPDDILCSFTAFFEELLTTDDFESALDKLNRNNLSRVEFHHMNSEVLFEKILRRYEDAFKQSSNEFPSLINNLIDDLWTKDSQHYLTRFGNKDDFATSLKVNFGDLITYLKGLRSRFLHLET